MESRHDNGGMSGMSEAEFTSMIEETSVNTVFCKYSLQNNESSAIIGASLTDIIEDGLSMVYSFYEPEFKELSLGKYMILDHINLAKEMNLPYLYLGYWVEGSEKMQYKSQYEPLEVFVDGKWQLLKRKNLVTNSADFIKKSSEDLSYNTIYLPTNNT
mgnify:FL=1